MKTEQKGLEVHPVGSWAIISMIQLQIHFFLVGVLSLQSGTLKLLWIEHLDSSDQATLCAKTWMLHVFCVSLSYIAGNILMLYLSSLIHTAQHCLHCLAADRQCSM